MLLVLQNSILEFGPNLLSNRISTDSLEADAASEEVDDFHGGEDAESEAEPKESTRVS
jgi:hypothetical protein